MTRGRDRNPGRHAGKVGGRQISLYPADGRKIFSEDNEVALTEMEAA